MSKNLILSTFFVVLVLSAQSLGQDWRQLVPLPSTCEDIKRILKIEKCTFPVSNYDLPDFEVNISFEESEQKVKGDPKIAGIIILFKKWPMLQNFESDLSSFELLPDDDIESGRIYKSACKGFSFTTQIVLGDFDQENVSGVQIFPAKTEKCGNRRRSVGWLETNPFIKLSMAEKTG